MVAFSLRLFALGFAAIRVEAIPDPFPVVQPMERDALLKRYFTPQHPVLPKVPSASAPCAGLTPCIGFCCPSDQFCFRSGCVPAGVTTCPDGGYCQADEGCCVTGCFPLNVGATCCGTKTKGIWCPANFQCIGNVVKGFKCCTDSTCDVYLDGSSTISVPVSTPTTTTNTTIITVTTTTTTNNTNTITTTTNSTNTIATITDNTNNIATTTNNTNTIATTTSSPPRPTKCNPTGPQPTFHLVTGTYSYISLSPAPGLQGLSSVVDFIGNNVGQAALFTFNSACNLVAVGNKWVADIPGIPYEGGSVAVHFDSLARISKTGRVKFLCDLQSGEQLTCKAGTNLKAGKWFECGTPSALQYSLGGAGACAKVVNFKAILV